MIPLLACMHKKNCIILLYTCNNSSTCSSVAFGGSFSVGVVGRERERDPMLDLLAEPRGLPPPPPPVSLSVLMRSRFTGW